MLLVTPIWRPFCFTLLGVFAATVWAAVEFSDGKSQVDGTVSRGVSRIVFAAFVGAAALASTWPFDASE
tara:strand:+ start:1205 stop:1411 length:207 start_codon:yes stop_codon:yes gene_type:complete